MANELPMRESGFQAVHAQSGASASSTPWLSLGKNVFEKGLKSLDKLEKNIIDVEDFTSKQEADYQIADVTSRKKAELNDLLSLPDGAENAFYDEQGRLRANKVKDFLSGCQKDLEPAGMLGLTPQTKEENYWKTKRAFLGLSNSFLGEGIEKQLVDARESLMNNYKLAMAQNRFSDASAIALEGEALRLLKDNEGKILSHEATKQGYHSAIIAELEDAPGRAGAFLRSAEADKYFTANEKKSLLKQIKKTIEDRDKQAFYNTSLKTSLLDDTTETNKRAKQAINDPLSTGSFTAQEVLWVSQLRDGRNIEQVTEQIRAAIIDESNNPNLNEDKLSAQDKFIKKWGRYMDGNKQLFSNDFLKEVFKRGRDRAGEGSNGKFEAKAFLDTAQIERELVNDREWGKIVEDIENGDYRNTFSLSLEGKDEEEAEIWLKNKLLGEHREVIKAHIINDYNNWLNTKAGKESNPLTQALKLQEIMKTRTGRIFNFAQQGNAYVVEVPRAQADINYQEYLKRVSEINKATQNKMAGKDGLNFPTAKNACPIPVDSMAGYATKEANIEPHEILLPKSMMKGCEAGKTTVQLTFANRHVRVFTVAGECEGNYPLMSNKLGNYGFNTDKKQKVQIEPLSPRRGEEAIKAQKNLYQQQQQYQETQRKNNSDMMDIIMQQEVRRDKQGRIAVYYPPAGDGGGAFEVAGINVASHPQEAHKLKRLIEQGNYQEAEEEARRYYRAYTNHIAELLHTDEGRQYDRGVELMVRDIALNSGPNRARAILKRALSLSDNASEDQVRARLNSYESSDDELKIALYRERDKFYNSLASKNPRKRQFLNGWARRNREVLSYALTIS